MRNKVAVVINKISLNLGLNIKSKDLIEKWEIKFFYFLCDGNGLFK